MAHGSFDPQLLADAARRLMTAASDLADLTGKLASIAHDSVPDPVAGQLADLKSHSHDMIKDVGDEATAIAGKLQRVAHAYGDLESSIMRAFQGTS